MSNTNNDVVFTIEANDGYRHVIKSRLDAEWLEQKIEEGYNPNDKLQNALQKYQNTLNNQDIKGDDDETTTTLTEVFPVEKTIIVYE